MDFSYLRPPRNLSHLKYSVKQIDVDHTTGKRYRLIFQNVQYQSDEKQSVYKFRQYLKQKDPNRNYPDHLLLKFSYMTNFYLPESINLFKIYEEWNSNQEIINANPKARKVLQSGVFYQYGRDPQYRPVIYFKPNQVNLTKFTETQYLNAMNYLLKIVQQHMLVEGLIEKWIVVVDLQNKQICLPIQLIQNNIKKIAIAFPQRLKNLLIVNPHKTSIGFINQLKSKVPPNIVSFQFPKTHICKTAKDLERFIDDNERQNKYDGSLDNIYQFWPIKSTNRLHQDSTLYPLVDSQTQFQSVLNDQKFFQQANQSHVCCSSDQCIIM